jgi:hypothetical protein
MVITLFLTWWGSVGPEKPTRFQVIILYLIVYQGIYTREAVAGINKKITDLGIGIHSDDDSDF